MPKPAMPTRALRFVVMLSTTLPSYTAAAASTAFDSVQPGMGSLLLAIALAFAAGIALSRTVIYRQQRTLSRTRGIKQAILEASPDGIITINQDGRIVQSNPACEKLFGYTRKELTDKTIALLMPKRFVREHDHNFRHYSGRQTRHVVGKERIVTGRRKDGSEFPVEISIGQKRLRGQTLFTGIIRDVSERIEQEQRIIADERILSALLRATDESVLIFDRQGICTFANQAAIDLQPLGGSTLTGKHILDLNLLGYPALQAERLYEILRSNQALEDELCLDTTWYEVHWYPLKGEHALIDSAAVFLRDISARKQAEKELQDAKIRIERASQAKSAFLSKVSHEFRTPLNCILGFAQLLVDDDQLHHAQREQIRLMRDSGEHLLGLVNDILDLTKIESNVLNIPLGRTDIVAVVQECFNWSKSIAQQSDIELCLSATNDTCYVMSNPARLKQVLLNLISNAIKYTSRGGKVMIELCPMTDTLAIVIRDNGNGIPRSQHSQVFKTFKRLGQEDSIEGSGIGLALSKELIHAMDGDIGFDSREGEGSEFWIKLPMAGSHQKSGPAHAIPSPFRMNEASSAALASEAPKTKSRSEREPRRNVLYIEDNTANVRLVESILTRYEKLCVRTAEDRATAIEALKAGHFDLILMDLDLPDGNGIDLLAYLRSENLNAGAPVIALTADALTQTRQKCEEADFDAFITKPVDIPEFLRTIRRYLRSTEPSNSSRSA